ncbi:hypothetical protein KTH02_15905 [Acinetobacter radioresistens]|uniref:hypothetical protein n=1 Tax=Acinetobacter TaxID=469 RepID=UPI0021CDB5A1|nr:MULTISPECIES: hypothetical protein [Acinetobacter]MCU4310305.1 hypothetical protein [Acinetobacter radioresistens]MDY6458089.1 hypothetical protein [Acinetobacter faecalis]
MKYLLTLLLAINATTYADFRDDYVAGRENDYFKPIKVLNQKQYNYILDNLVLSAAMANELKGKARATSQILKDYDSVLKYKSQACQAYEITKTLEDFFKTNKEFERSIDKERVYAFVSRAKLTEIEISGCDAIHRTYWNHMLDKGQKNK